MVKFPITQKGYKKLEQEIKYLKYTERPAVIDAITTAREFGDLSENAEYHAAREKQSFIEGRILELESKFAHSDIIDFTKLSNDSVKFGATIKLIDDDSKEKYTYHLVGEYEADMKKNRISIQSPLAKALIGKSVGDIVEVSTPKGGKVYELLAINFIQLD